MGRAQWRGARMGDKWGVVDASPTISASRVLMRLFPLGRRIDVANLVVSTGCPRRGGDMWLKIAQLGAVSLVRGPRSKFISPVKTGDLSNALVDPRWVHMWEIVDD